MSEAVCNASPLIVLAKSGLLHILPKLFDRVFLPQAVAEEIAAGPFDDPMRLALPRSPWLETVSLTPPISPMSTWQLGKGEAEVIEYARLHGNLPVLLDDRAARRAAAALELKVYGTLALTAMAAKLGYLESFASAVATLKTAGLYVSDQVLNAVQEKLPSGSE